MAVMSMMFEMHWTMAVVTGMLAMMMVIMMLTVLVVGILMEVVPVSMMANFVSHLMQKFW